MGYKNVIKREITHLKEDKLGLLVSFVFPLILCLLMCFIFIKGTPTNLPVAVWNADNSKLSRTIVRDVNTLQSCKVKYQVTNLEEGKKLLTEGKIYAFLVIPKNFQRDIYRQAQPKLVFYYNNQRILIGGVIYKDINVLAQSMKVGIDAKIRSNYGMKFKDAIKQANTINLVEHVHSNPYFNYLYCLSLIAFGHILQISIVFTSIWAIGTEFKYGKTKEWLKEADNSIITAFIGKMTPYFVIFTLLFLILYFIYFGILHAPYTGNILFGFLTTLLFIITCLFLGNIFISINGNFRYCLSFAAFYVAMGFALAGVTYPTMAMPTIAKIYGATSPLNHWIAVMLDQTMRNVPMVYDLHYFITPFIIIFISALMLHRLRIIAKDENRWYKI